MTAVMYEFEKIDVRRQRNYIFQTVKGRKLTGIYHSHDFFELICVLGGSGVQIVNEEERVCERGDVVLLRPGDRHCFARQSEDIEILSLSVKKEEFKLICDSYHSMLTRSIDSEGAPVCYRTALSLLWDICGGEVTEFDCKLILSCLLNAYIRAADYENDGARLPPMLARAVDEMQKCENLREGIEAFTRLSHYSHSHLGRLVKKHFGVSLKRFINEMRLQRAYNDIVLTGESADVISENLGFSSFSHFSKIFKERFSLTPAALRKNGGVGTI